MTTCVVPGCDAQKYGERLSLHLFPDPSKEPERHLKWVRIISAEKIFRKEPMVVFRQLRVCRAHFDEKSFNGVCKKLLQTAIPTRNLRPIHIAHFKTKLQSYELKMKKVLQQNSIDLQDDHLQVKTENYEQPKIDDDVLSPQDKLWLSEVDEEEQDIEEFELMEIEELQSEEQKFTIVMKDNRKSEKTTRSLAELLAKPKAPIIMEENSFQVPSLKSPMEKSARRFKSLKPLSLLKIQKFRKEFQKCSKKQLAQNIVTKVDPLEILISRSKCGFDEQTFQFTVDIDKGTKAFHENYWSTSAHDLMRIPFIKQWNLVEFEFSQAYFFYWDKIERSYYFLNNIVETAKRGEDVNGRLVSFLLGDPIGDGGQWDMIVSIINKHGVMPRKCFPESFSCESSARMNAILKSKLREYAKQLRDLHSSGAPDVDVQAKVDHQMGEIYNIVGICLGIPPETFTWEFYDKNKKYNSIGPISALDFYEKHVKPYFNIDDKVCLVTDPRPSNDFGKGYTVDCLGNVVGGRVVFYNNQPVDVLIDLVAKSLKSGEAVWLVCDVRKKLAFSSGIEELDLFNYKLLFECDVEMGISKADRMEYCGSFPTCSLTISGFGTDDEGNVTKFRVENSLKNLVKGAEANSCKFLLMTRQWFEEFVFGIVVDRKNLSEEILNVFDTEPSILPAWDPMGKLVL